jgi:hypothetical protein
MTAERDRQKEQALDLHLACTPLGQIAEIMGLTEARVRKLIADALDDKVGPNLPDRARTEIARIDKALAGIWRDVQGGDLDAIDRMLRLHERRERLASPRDNTQELTKAYERTTKASKALIGGLDDALIEMGRKTCIQIDRICAIGNEVEIAKALYLQPHVVKALREMLATPAARADAEGKKPSSGTPEGQATVSKLAQLRSVGKRA